MGCWRPIYVLAGMDTTSLSALRTIKVSKPERAMTPNFGSPKMEDCPVCFVPLPLESEKSTYKFCCGKLVCNACNEEHFRGQKITKRKREKKGLPPLPDRSCPFCREPVHKNDSELIKQVEERVAKGDIEAMLSMAIYCRDGLRGFPKDETKALDLFKRAANMGFAAAIYHIGLYYIKGYSGFPIDEKKSIVFFVNAVKMGHVFSRCVLAANFSDEGNFHLANKHLRLAAEAGSKVAVKLLWEHLSDGKLSKTDLEEILRAHQSACDEMDSEDRRRYDAYQEALAGTDTMRKNLYRTYYSGYMNAKQLKEVLGMHQKGCGFEKIREFLKKVGTFPTGKYSINLLGPSMTK